MSIDPKKMNSQLQKREFDFAKFCGLLRIPNDFLPKFFIDFDIPLICSRCSFVFEDKCKTISVPKCTIDLIFALLRKAEF